MEKQGLETHTLIWDAELPKGNSTAAPNAHSPVDYKSLKESFTSHQIDPNRKEVILKKVHLFVYNVEIKTNEPFVGLIQHCLASLSLDQVETRRQ